MALDDDIHELISRGLDADLDRSEMRRLYRLVARHPEMAGEMAELAALEEGLSDWAVDSRETPPQTDLTAAAVAEAAAGRRSPWSRLLHWLHSPQGISIQPFSFAGGIAMAALLMWITLPQGVAPLPDGATAQRLRIHDVQFVNAKARVDWTNRFIVPPGGATRLSLGSGGDRPVHIQFETIEPVDLMVAHTTPGGRRDVVRSFTVDGIGFATLRKPRSGDMLAIRNDGEVPTLVYMRGLGDTTVSGFQAGETSQAL